VAAGIALQELVVMPRDEGWNQSGRLSSGNGMEHDITVGASELSLFGKIKVKGKFVTELTELVIEVIARDQGMTAAEYSASCQISVAREEPPILPEHTLDQHLVRDDLFISRVVAEDAKPPCEATEHRIGHKSRDRLIGLSTSVQGENLRQLICRP
jgi:hypothetical protein